MKNKQFLAEINVFLKDESETETLAKQFAPLLTKMNSTSDTAPSGGHIYLRGDLGAGKTCFARALLRACGVTGRIKSPSYALLESYKVSNLYFYHLDFYRFSNPREWIDAGFRDILQENAIVLIEWPEQAGNLLPAPDVEIYLEYRDHGRNARITAYSKKGQSWLSKITPPGTELSPKDSPAGDS
jgi:tRNA threonylcarbamoyladenosine biosynthesis protein TsaE